MSEVSGLPDVVTDAETLAVPDVATRLSIPKSSVHQLVRDGKLLSYRTGGEVVVPGAHAGTSAPRRTTTPAKRPVVPLRRDHPEATWCSAGMSADLEAAVAAGATHLRVGSAILGPRPAAG